MQNGNLKVIVDDQEFEFTPGELEEIRHQAPEAVLLAQKVYRGNTRKIVDRTYETEADGLTYTVKIRNRWDEIIDRLDMRSKGGQKQTVLKAPMPGLVLKIAAREGELLQETDTALILEAMKMENVLKLAHPATVKKIYVKEGEAVDKGQVLLELE
jgi:biotin carboxyl carrier protein